MNAYKKQQGFTLIELVMVIVLLTIIAAISSKIISQGLSAYLTGKNAIDAIWQGEFAMERMARNIAQVRSANDIAVQSSSEFSFTDINGNSIDYKLSGSSLLYNTQILADGINSLSFGYYDKNGSSVGSSSINLHYVTITLNITQNNTNYTLSRAVYLRDLSS